MLYDRLWSTSVDDIRIGPHRIPVTGNNDSFENGKSKIIIIIIIKIIIINNGNNNDKEPITILITKYNDK